MLLEGVRVFASAHGALNGIKGLLFIPVTFDSIQIPGSHLAFLVNSFHFWKGYRDDQ